jgi:hypothetical protein
LIPPQTTILSKGLDTSTCLNFQAVQFVWNNTRPSKFLCYNTPASQDRSFRVFVYQIFRIRQITYGNSSIGSSIEFSIIFRRSIQITMCLVDLNRSTLSCNHLWYHLIEGCSPTTTLDNCPGKTMVSGWEIRSEFCRFISL